MKYYLLTLLFLPQIALAQTSSDSKDEQKQYEVVQFLKNQVANPRELLTDSFLIALIDVSFGEFTKNLGKNPNAKLILRDFSKIPGLIANILQGNEVAGTGYFYDVSHIYGHSTKIATKLGAFLILNKLGLNIGTAAVWANIPGDSVGRFFLIVGQARQDLAKADSFHSFFIEKFQSKWFSDTLMQQLPNLPVMHVLGTLAGSYTLGDKVQGAVLSGIATFLSHDVRTGSTFAQNAAQVTSASQKMKIFLIMLVASTSEKAFFNFVFPPISRVMMTLGSYLRGCLPDLSGSSTKEEL